MVKMFKRMVCVLMMLAMLTAAMTVVGCDKEVTTTTETEIEKVPVGNPTVVID
jgi:hypothetical protein